MSFTKFMRYALAWLVLGLAGWFVGSYSVKAAIAVGKETNGLIGFIVFFLIAAIWLWFLTSGGLNKIFEAISGDKLKDDNDDEEKSE